MSFWQQMSFFQPAPLNSPPESPPAERGPQLERLLREVRACCHCAELLPLPPKPILRVEASAVILLVGQAPGLRVHESGIPWHDRSGERLRSWMQIDRQTFYDQRRIAIIPVGFCYPGKSKSKGASGDLPPRPECAHLWHPLLWQHLPRLKLIILLGRYAHQYYLRASQGRTLRETVERAPQYHPYLPLPHPSPRNIGWFRQNPWFESRIIPYMQAEVRRLL